MESSAVKNIFIYHDVKCTKFMWSKQHMADVLWLSPGNDTHGPHLFQK